MTNGTGLIRWLGILRELLARLGPALPIAERGIALACVMALAAYFLMSRPSSRDEEARIRAVEELGEKLRQSGEESYLRDRARGIDGSVLDAQGDPSSAKIQVVDAIRLSETIAAQAGKGMAAFLGTGPVIEHEVATNESGRYRIENPSLGNKMLFVFPKGDFTPLRRENVNVNDGVGVWMRPIRLSERKERHIVADLSQEPLELLPVYGGWWPDLRFVSVPPGDWHAVEWRDPDGYPRGFLARLKGGETRFYAVVQEQWEMGEQLCLSGLSDDPPTRERISGLPDLAASPVNALALLRGSSSLHGSGETTVRRRGHAAVKAEAGYSVVRITLDDGVEISRYTDAFGESLDHVPFGIHTVRTSYPLGGLTRSKGLVVGSKEVSRVTFWMGDRTPESHSCTIMGFLVRHSAGGERLPTRGLVYCQSLAGMGHPGGYVESAEPNEDGFFRFEKLKPGATYDLVYCSREGIEYARRVRRMTIPAQGHPDEFRIDLVLGDCELTIEMPDPPSDADSVAVVQDGSGDFIERPLDVRGRRSLKIQDLGHGTYHAVLYRNREPIAKTAPVNLEPEGQGKQKIVSIWTRYSDP